MNYIVFEVLWNKTLFFYGSVNYSAQYFILFYWLVQLVKGNFKSSVAVPDICKDRKCQWSLDFTIQQEYKQMLNCVDIFLKWPNLGSCSRDCAHHLIRWWYDDMRCTRGGLGKVLRSPTNHNRLCPLVTKHKACVFRWTRHARAKFNTAYSFHDEVLPNEILLHWLTREKGAAHCGEISFNTKEMAENIK